MRTQSGLWIDDDLDFRPEDIELAFETYRQLANHQHRIVGFSGRLVDKDQNDNWAYRVFELDYNMILTNAAFLDTKMLEWFWTEDFRIERSIEYVDEHMNCEDILFNCKLHSTKHLLHHSCRANISILPQSSFQIEHTYLPSLWNQ